MGLDINGTKFILYARSRGVSFDKTAMIGRQELLIERVGLERNLRQFGLVVPESEMEKMLEGPTPYAEGFLTEIGANEIVSFDASAYEGAAVIHDFNLPISDDQKMRFSAVLDGGTLEHIFNFPTAIKNCMEMVAEGGHFLAITPANNHAGHGFYQFSPELFFRIFSAENGFEIEHLIVFEETLNSPWYEVADPKIVKQRVTLVNEYPTMLLIIARKVSTVEIFSHPPQQSDYQSAWTGDSSSIPSRPNDPLGLSSMIRRIPAAVFRRVKLKFDQRTGVLNRRSSHFKKIDLP